jgi:hypothetical protein
VTSQADIRASKIQLLCGVPTSKAAFAARVGTSDFLRKYRTASDAEHVMGEIDRAWQNDYSPLIADPLALLIRSAQELRIEVDTDANLTALKAATSNKRVVIILSHWKGPEIVADDLLSQVGKAAFAARPKNLRNAFGRWLAAELGRSPSVKSLWPFANARVLTLTEILNQALSVRLEETNVLVDRVLEQPQTLSARRREILDMTFDGLLTPGNRLELFDGLHSKEQIETAIAPNFDGILDLTTCTSAYLADYIGGKRHHRFRIVQFPTVQEPLWTVLYLKATLDLAVTGGLPYLVARDRALATLRDAISR